MDTSTPFKWRHFQAGIILLCVRWYLRYPLSYRDLEEMMASEDCTSTTPQSTALVQDLRTRTGEALSTPVLATWDIRSKIRGEEQCGKPCSLCG